MSTLISSNCTFMELKYEWQQPSRLETKQFKLYLYGIEIVVCVVIAPVCRVQIVPLWN